MQPFLVFLGNTYVHQAGATSFADRNLLYYDYFVLQVSKLLDVIFSVTVVVSHLKKPAILSLDPRPLYTSTIRPVKHFNT